MYVTVQYTILKSVKNMVPIFFSSLHSNTTDSGCPDGDIALYDKNTYKKASNIPAHSGTISDFDICDNLLVSCGFASRGNDMSVKRSLLVYDLRMMRSLNAVHCSIDPVQLRFMPMYHSQVRLIFEIVVTGIGPKRSQLGFELKT